jgi:hypothetical protein
MGRMGSHLHMRMQAADLKRLEDLAAAREAKLATDAAAHAAALQVSQQC